MDDYFLGDASKPLEPFFTNKQTELSGDFWPRSGYFSKFFKIPFPASIWAKLTCHLTLVNIDQVVSCPPLPLVRRTER